MKALLYLATKSRRLRLDLANYVDFGDVSRQQLGLQCQYGSRYIDGYIDGWPNLGKGLRFIGFDSGGHINNYHAMKIHRDDVEEFVRRVKSITKVFGDVTGNNARDNILAPLTVV